MLENQHMTEELQMQSEAMERLIRENTALAADKAALQMQVRLQREQEVATALHGCPAEVKRSLGSSRRHTIREGKIKLLSEVQAHDQKLSAAALEGGLRAELAESRKQEDARRLRQVSLHSL